MGARRVLVLLTAARRRERAARSKAPAGDSGILVPLKAPRDDTEATLVCFPDAGGNAVPLRPSPRRMTSFSDTSPASSSTTRIAASELPPSSKKVVGDADARGLDVEHLPRRRR